MKLIIILTWEENNFAILAQFLLWKPVITDKLCPKMARFTSLSSLSMMVYYDLNWKINDLDM